MADPEFDTEAERQAYAAGLEEAAKKMQKPRLTREQIRQMDEREIMARMPEVRAALKSGHTTDEGSDDDEAAS